MKIIIETDNNEKTNGKTNEEIKRAIEKVRFNLNFSKSEERLIRDKTLQEISIILLGDSND